MSALSNINCAILNTNISYTAADAVTLSWPGPTPNIPVPIFHFHWPTPNTLPYSFFFNLSFSSFIHSFHWHVQNATIPCPSQELLPFLSVTYFFPATLLHQLFFHSLSLHLAIYFLVYHSILLFLNSYIILFWESYFLPFSVHAQTIVICFTLLL